MSARSKPCAHFKMYIRWRILYHIARRWLRAGDPDDIAAHTMFRLNRTARRSGPSPRRRYIYALKSRLVEQFYRAGYCIAATVSIQTLYCHACGGTGDYWDHGDCYRCDGTGIYRRHTLYRFTFDVHGQRYTWHQPEALVTWPVTLTDDEPGTYEDRAGRVGGSTSRRDVELYYVTLYTYLQQRGMLDGIPRENLICPTLRDALQSDVRDWWRGTRFYEWYRWTARPRLRQLRKWWQTGAFEQEDEIPF